MKIIAIRYTDIINFEILEIITWTTKKTESRERRTSRKVYMCWYYTFAYRGLDIMLEADKSSIEIWV